MAEALAAIGIVLNSDGSISRIPSPIFPQLPPSTDDNVATKDIILHPTNPNLWARLFLPHNPTNKSLPLLIFFHGGGFIFLSPATAQLQNLCARISKQHNAIVISLNYSLAPEHRLPAAYQDGFALLQWLNDFRNEEEAEDLAAADFSKVFIMGDSAGANIAHHVALRAAQEQESLSFRLAGLILLQPFFGGVSRTESEVRLAKEGSLGVDFFWNFALPQGADMDHRFCNVALNLPQDLSSLKDSKLVPKTLIVVGGLDLLSDRQIEYAKILEEAGHNVKLVLYENADHAFYNQPDSSISTLLLDEIVNFCT